MDLLDVSGIHTAYGLNKVLHGVSFSVGRGELVALVGRNGVGKSTTMKSIIGIAPPNQGTVVFKGTDITRKRPHVNARMGIGYVPEDRRVFSNLSVWENLDVARLPASASQTTWDEERVFAMFPDLRRFETRKGGLLSGGQQQMLTIARTLMGNPELLLLDEPSEGLAPLVVAQIADKIRELKSLGLSIMLAEQNLDFVLALADRCLVLEKGSVVFTGAAAELRERADIHDKYLNV